MALLGHARKKFGPAVAPKDRLSAEPAEDPQRQDRRAAC